MSWERRRSTRRRSCDGIPPERRPCIHLPPRLHNTQHLTQSSPIKHPSGQVWLTRRLTRGERPEICRARALVLQMPSRIPWLSQVRQSYMHQSTRYPLEAIPPSTQRKAIARCHTATLQGNAALVNLRTWLRPFHQAPSFVLRRSRRGGEQCV